MADGAILRRVFAVAGGGYKDLHACALHSYSFTHRRIESSRDALLGGHLQCHGRRWCLAPRPPVMAAWLRDRSRVLVCAFAAQDTRAIKKRSSQAAAGSSEEMKISVSFGSEAEEPRAASSDEAMSTSVASEGFPWQRGLPMNLAGGAVLTASVVMMAVIGFLLKPKEDSHGSVFDLVRRGQLRSDRGADSRPLNYEDPFNNPLIQVADKNSTVKVDGRRFRVQPVMLTDEKVQSHQSRRSQAYRWKRPVLFLNDGDAVPDGVDPDEVRWIPSNHPFATTNNYIDEDLAQKNVYQTTGVPSRVRAEHEALRRKMMEATARESVTELPSDLGNEGWKGFGQEQIKP